MLRKKVATMDPRSYFRFNWWKYALVIVVAIFGLGLVFDVTEDKAEGVALLDVYICAGDMSQYDADALAEAFHASIKEEYPRVEEVLFFGIPVDMARQNDYVYQMQFVLHMREQLGDVFIVSKTRFEEMLPEKPYIELSGFEALKGLPFYDDEGKAAALDISSLAGLQEAIGLDTEGLLLFLPYYCDNVEESVQVACWLFDNYSR